MAIVLSGTTGIDAGSLPVSNCGNTEVEGNLNLSGIGTRITGDFSNATYSNRIAFQTNVPNTYTTVAAIPNGTGANASFQCYSSSDMNNSTRIHMSASTTVVEITSSYVGAASYVPLVFSTGGSERVRIDTAGNVGIGTTVINNKLEVNGSIGFGSVTGNGRIYSDANWGCLLQSDVSSPSAAEFGFLNNAGAQLAIIDTSGNLLLKSGNGGLGYGTGAGGTVTQPPSDGFGGIGKGSRVTLNKPSGQITMNNAALAAGASVEFYLYNSLLTSTDTLVVSGGIYSYNYTTQVKTVSSGIATIRVTNVTGGTLSEALGISFTVIKGATA